MRKYLLCFGLLFLVLLACTRDENPPTLSYEFSDVDAKAGITSCIITCRNESVDDEKIHARVLLSKSEDFENITTHLLHLSGDTLYGTLNGLERNTLYYYCFEMFTNKESQRIDGVYEFRTINGGNITVTTSEVINITQSTATGGGSVSSDGDYTITERGICWGTRHNPDNQGNHAANGAGAGSFSVNMTDLIPDSTYYVRAYAACAGGVVYGNEVSFTTQNANLPTVSTLAVSNITRTSALASGNVADDGGLEVIERGVCWSTAHNPDIEGSHANNGTGIGAFSIEIGELVPNTKYYVRAYAQNNKGIAYGEEVEFKTAQDISSPIVTTSQVTNITSNSATGGGNVTNDGGAAVTQRGVCWSTGHNPTVDDAHATSGAGIGEFSVAIADLTPGTTYYVRAYAENSQGVSYGMEVGFSTTANLPTVTTGEVSNITQTTALGSGTVTDDGGVEVTERGVCWSKNHNPTLNDSHANNGTGIGGFTVEMTGLTSNTIYYVRAYAINSQGTTYGNEKEFKTSQNVSAPTVTTSEVSNITQTTAKGGGYVASDGGATVTERGICWSTNHNPTINGSHAHSGTGMGTFTCNMTGLTAGTTYYVRAYAKNSEGTSYGAEVSFITQQAITLPTVTTSQVSNITQTTATGGGNVTATGNATVTERGICWSTSHNPTTSGGHASSGGGTGMYLVNMTGLTPNTTYYVRAYATNSAGTAYGSEVSFTTLQNVSLPTVSTSQVTNITQTAATGGGNVTSAGGANVTERGICWSTSHNPTTSNTHANSGTGTGTFTINMTNLTANTTYYVRAYAINSAGTAYGAEVGFTTLQSVTPPTVTTSQVTNINQTSATGGGNVTATGGGTVTDRGICWSTSHNPTISGNHASGGTGAGTFSVNMNNLTANTTYYVRAYATNSAGTAYGSEVVFTTTSIPTYTISVSANPTNGGNVSGSGTYQQGQSCTVSATANSGYTFTNWTENGSVVSTNSSYAFTVTNNRTLVASFTANSQNYTISVSANPTNGGNVSGGGTYQQGQSCTVTATTNNGYSFTNWTENGSQVSTNSSYTFTVNGNRTLVANYYPVPSWPNGVLPGVFSVGATKQVRFSQGNLQYIGSASTPYWKFADFQWEYLGDNGQGSNSQYSNRDLFGWATSGWDNGNTYYYPWNTEDQGSLYGPPSNHDLIGDYSNSDWGVYNAISNGGSQAGLWRTLSNTEWQYVFNTRNTLTGIRYAKAIVNNVNGIILLPDNWSESFYELNNVNSSIANYNSNIITAGQWATLEQYGAVFLSAAGTRVGLSVNVVGNSGGYWSTSSLLDYTARWIVFVNDNLQLNSHCNRSNGNSVRLVQDY